MTDLDVQVYKELLMTESEKLEKAAYKINESGSPPEAIRISAKKDGILTALYLLEQVQQQKKGRMSVLRRRLVASGQYSEDGSRVATKKKQTEMQVPEWMDGFDPDRILAAEREVSA